MTASRGARRAFQRTGVLVPSNPCLRSVFSHQRLSVRHYSATATAAATAPSAAATTSTQTPEPAAAPPSSSYDIRSGLILTRPPLLTRRLTPFENAYFFYQKRLEERLNTPFVTDVYFKPDTARRLDWDLKVRERKGTVAKELGQYHGKSAGAWDDELRVGDEPLSDQDGIVRSLLKDAEARVSDDAEIIPEADVVPIEPPRPRETEADRKGDVTRLDRALERTLYLVVKGKDGWGFPADLIPEGENLHESAKRVLDQAAGVNMNTWIVGRVPVAHVTQEPVHAADGSVKQRGQKTFFIKGRIMAGQANLKGNPFGYTEFKWLTKEELEKELPETYFKGVRNMMADR